MTLFRQIAVATSVLVISLMGLTMYSNYRTDMLFIEDQLYINAKNTASSLGLAISKTADGKDEAMAETMINAVFDSGLYEAIVFTDVDGKTIYERRVPMKIDNVPEWFTELIKLPPAVAEVPVGREWMMVGQLRIESHRGFAYAQLWDVFKEVVVSFVLLSMLALVGIYFMLKIVLRSLRKVREQAEAVAGNRFIIQDELPHTREFRDVVVALNSLVYKVKDIYKHEADAIARYNALLYDDRQTHLKNRDFFMMKLKSVLTAEDRFSEGFIVILRLQEPDAVKNEQGAFALHKQLMELSDIARTAVNRIGEGFACRVREYDIMLILPSQDEAEVLQLLKSLASSCELCGCGVGIAAAAYRFGEEVSEVLAHVDYALMQSEVAKGDTPTLYRSERTDVPAWGHDEWRRNLLDAMKNDRFVPLFQSVTDRRGGTVQKELLLRLKVEDRLLNAGLFIPVVLHLELENEVDRYVLERMAETPHAAEVAVNISGEFMRKSTTMHWLTSRHGTWKADGVKIALEVPNSVVLEDVETAVAFSNFVRELGFRFGIDHFIVDSGDLAYLQKIKPSYLKINAQYLLSLSEPQDDSKRNSALFTIARILDIDLIATGVDSKETSERLYESGITMLQGFWIDEPHEETL
jgi:EAL domain-containing protein (putative c-di-GMP-specific phosphodiesterase class I)